MPNYNLVVADSFDSFALVDLITNKLDGGHAHLFTNTPTIDHSQTLGIYAEASWPGYAAQTMTPWSGVSVNVSNESFATCGPLTWDNTDTVAHTANGYYLTDSGGALIGGAYFPTPQNLPASLGMQDVITFIVQKQFSTSP